jgi:hypothetical protein
MLILHERPHVQDGVVGARLAVGRLLDTGELKIVSENQAAILSDIIQSFAYLEGGGAKRILLMWV